MENSDKVVLVTAAAYHQLMANGFLKDGADPVRDPKMFMDMPVFISPQSRWSVKNVEMVITTVEEVPGYITHRLERFDLQKN